MSLIPNAAMYRWTHDDHEQARMGAPVLTPYEIPASRLEKPEETTAGTRIPLQLDQFMGIEAVARFDLGMEVVWEEVPPAAAGAKTLAELCAKLQETRSPRYPDAFYKLEGMDLSQRTHRARLLFEYWGNTDYRYAVIMAGGFQRSFFDGKHDAMSILPIQGKYVDSNGKGEKETVQERIKYIPVVREGAHFGAVAPGATPQTVQLSDPRLSRLDPDFSEIRRTVARIKSLLEQSERFMKERLATVQQLTALRTLLEQSGNTRRGSFSRANSLADTARALERAALKAMKEVPNKEALGGGSSAMPPTLQAIVRKDLGVVEDIGKEVQLASQKLCSKIVHDTGFAGRCGDWVRLGIKDKLHALPEFANRRDKFVAALVEALDVLLETGIDQEAADKLYEAISNTLDKPAIDIGHVQDKTSVDAFLSLLGPFRPYARFALQNAPSLVGNLAGPPSLYVAVVQVRAWWKIRNIALDSKSDIEAFLQDTTRHLSKGLQMKDETRKAFESAMRERDFKKLKAIKQDVLDEYSGTLQSTKNWKMGGLALQLVAFLIALSDFMDRKHHTYGDDLEFLDYLGIISQGTSTVIGAVDLISTVFNVLQKFSAALQGIGMTCGLVSSAFGMIAAGMQFSKAYNSGDTLGMVGAGAGFAGNLMLGAACIVWLLPGGLVVPGLNIAAIVLLAIGGGISIYQVSQEENRSGVNKVASSLVDTILKGPFFRALETQPDFETKLREIDAAVKDTSLFLPLPPNNPFVRAALRDAGFSDEHLAVVIDKDGAVSWAAEVPGL